ncbi:MAG: hypothetical protein H6617_10055 [Bdellovibrionaceae bacterium]|nr:hypothetical protein [Bdellovibrionales bacterium]MCB9255013.1 hypothetical protein [Pseudobdellovibrionaceae bacterium]
MRFRTLVFSLIGLVCLYSGTASAHANYHTPTDLAARFGEAFHPLEAPRGDAYLESVKRAGRNIACSVMVATYSNRLLQRAHHHIAKGFHNGIIGQALVKFELLSNRPEWTRHGLFSDDIPATVYGVASLTTGRADEDPWHLKPDVTGMSVGLDVNGKWTVLTTTASVGAFGSTLEGFSHLGSFSAIGAKFFGGIPMERIAYVLRTLKEDAPLDDEPYFFQGLRRRRMEIGGLIGEGAFVLRHPIAGLGTLVPAILSGRRTPFFGYRDVGFGSGHAYLLEETPQMKDRVAFRYGFRLAGPPYNQHIREKIPGWIKTFTRAIIDGDYSYLSTEFNRRMEEGEVVYEMYVQREDKDNPRRTPIERTHRRWKSEKIPVALVTLQGKPGNTAWSFVTSDTARMVRRMPFNPGFNFHLPLGDLGYGRAVGPLVNNISGAYWESAATRQARAIVGGSVDDAEMARALEEIQAVHRAARALQPN